MLGCIVSGEIEAIYELLYVMCIFIAFYDMINYIFGKNLLSDSESHDDSKDLTNKQVPCPQLSNMSITGLAENMWSQHSFTSVSGGQLSTVQSIIAISPDTGTAKCCLFLIKGVGGGLQHLTFAD